MEPIPHASDKQRDPTDDAADDPVALFRFHAEIVGQNAFGHYPGVMSVKGKLADPLADKVLRLFDASRQRHVACSRYQCRRYRGSDRRGDRAGGSTAFPALGRSLRSCFATLNGSNPVGMNAPTPQWRSINSHTPVHARLSKPRRRKPLKQM